MICMEKGISIFTNKFRKRLRWAVDKKIMAYAALYMDEAKSHLHIDYIPVAHGYM